MFEGVPIPVIDPPLIETVPEFWTAIEQRPKFDLAVEAAPTSDKLLLAVSLPSN